MTDPSKKNRYYSENLNYEPESKKLKKSLALDE